MDRVALSQFYVGVCGGQSGTITGLCGGLWWVEWHCNSFMWGLVVDRVAL